MACFRPIVGYKSRSVTDKGKRKVVFNVKEGFKDLPVELPCGRCIGCRLDYSRMWATRIMHEASLYDSNMFVTLTYKDEHKKYLGMQRGISKNPKSRDYGKEKDFVLAPYVKEDLQKFLKRVRARKGPFRYYACGEYGEFGPGHHPHFHLAMFGIDFSFDDIVPSNPELFISNEMKDLWPLGFHSLGEVNSLSGGYIARYCTKKISGPDKTTHYYVVDRFTGRRSPVPPEQAFMSRGRRKDGDGGIGYRWFEKYKDDCRKDFLTVEKKMYAVPRYYRERLEEVDPKVSERNKRRRKIERKKRESDNTVDMLAQRETVKKAQFKMLERSLENENT